MVNVRQVYCDDVPDDGIDEENWTPAQINPSPDPPEPIDPSAAQLGVVEHVVAPMVLPKATAHHPIIRRMRINPLLVSNPQRDPRTTTSPDRFVSSPSG